MVLAGADHAGAFWERLCEGRSQAVEVRRRSGGNAAVCAGVELGDFDYRRALPQLPEEHAKRYSRDILVTMSAASGALSDAGLARGDCDPARMGMIASTSRGPLGWWLGEDETPSASATQRALAGLTGTPATMSAIQLGLQGLVTTISNACVGGSQALGVASNQLRFGDADVMLVAGHEFPLVPGVIKSLQDLGVLADHRPDPAAAMRPYDQLRGGFVPGEGAIVLCLERYDHAARRGARAYAELLGQRSLNEAAHPTTMDQSGKRAAELVWQLVGDAEREVHEIDYVCGHGSATTYNDRAECRMLGQLFPEAPAQELPPLGSVKPVFGHTLGAAALVNVAACALMLHHQTVVPTANLGQAAQDCPGDHVAGGPRESRLRLAVSMSHALGSQSAAALLGSAQEL